MPSMRVSNKSKLPARVRAFVIAGATIGVALVVVVALKQWANEAFFDSFWPNFVSDLLATALAIILGIPVGLALNRQATEHEEARQHRAEQLELGNALLALLDTLRRNHEILGKRHALAIGEEGGDIFDTNLDTVSWEAVKSIVVERCGAPLLQGDIANYFERLETLVRLYNELLTLDLRRVPGKEAPIHEKHEKLRAFIKGRLVEMQEYTMYLIIEIVHYIRGKRDDFSDILPQLQEIVDAVPNLEKSLKERERERQDRRM